MKQKGRGIKTKAKRVDGEDNRKRHRWPVVGPSETSGGFVFGPRHASFTSWLSSINAFLRGQSAPFRDLPSIVADPCARQAKGHRIATRSSASQERRVLGRRNERGKGYWLQLSRERTSSTMEKGRGHDSTTTPSLSLSLSLSVLLEMERVILPRKTGCSFL